MSSEKGDRRERELVNRLDDAGFAVLRAPSSGSATTRALPDVLAGDGEHFYAIEAKASGSDRVYLSESELDALEDFAESFGADPLVGVRFDYQRWHFFEPAATLTDNGAYRVRKSREGYSIDDLAAGEFTA